MVPTLNRSDVFVNDSEIILMSDADYAAVELFKGYPDGLLKFAFACCVIFMIIGIPGNIITIVALAKYKRVRNATAILIMSLSCADLLFCCLNTSFVASIFWNKSWRYGGSFCRLYPPLKYIPMIASIFSILAITINRYVLIVYPQKYCKIYRDRNLTIIVAALWILPLILGIPTYLGKWGRYDLDQKFGSCTMVADKNNISPKRFWILAQLCLLYIPIIFCYGRIFLTVRNTTNNLNLARNIKSLVKNSPNSSTDKSTTQESSGTTNIAAAINYDNDMEKGRDTPIREITKFKSDNKEPMDVAINNKSTNTLISNELKSHRNVLQRTIASLNNKVTLPTRKDKRLGTMIFAIMIALCLFHFPILLIGLIEWSSSTEKYMYFATVLLLHYSTCINPVVYVVMSSEYRKAYKNLFKIKN